MAFKEICRQQPLKRTMKYSVTWSKKSVRVDYFGEVTNKDIQRAHFELNGDGRFYGCESLILDVTKCSLAKVVVPDLITVIATDLGAAHSIESFKVAMIADDSVNRERVSDYIERNQVSPWEFKLFHSIDDAQPWLNAEKTEA